MEVGDRVMIKAGRHGGMVGTITKVRFKMVRNPTGMRARKEPSAIEKPVGTIRFPSTGRSVDEILSNLRLAPTPPFG